MVRFARFVLMCITSRGSILRQQGRRSNTVVLLVLANFEKHAIISFISLFRLSCSINRHHLEINFTETNLSPSSQTEIITGLPPFIFLHYLTTHTRTNYVHSIFSFEGVVNETHKGRECCNLVSVHVQRCRA